MIPAPKESRANRHSIGAGDGIKNGDMGTPKSKAPKPLNHYVAGSLDSFFKTLNGHAPKDLYGMILDQVEPPLLKATLRYCEGNQSRAASILGLNRATLRKKIRQHKIQTSAAQ